MAQHSGASPAATEPACERGFVAGRRATLHRTGQKRVRMPIAPTIWFGVLDAPPEPLMKAW